MAVNDNALVLPSRGGVLVGAVGATAPTAATIATFVTSDGNTTPTGFTDLGHISVDGVNFTSDVSGGEALATFRSDTAALTPIVSVDGFTFSAEQFDGVSLPLYYGGGTVTSGKFAQPRFRTIQERAVVLVFWGGVETLWTYGPRCQIKPGSGPAIAPGAFGAFELVGTFLNPTGTASPAEWNRAGITVPA